MEIEVKNEQTKQKKKQKQINRKIINFIFRE